MTTIPISAEKLHRAYLLTSEMLGLGSALEADPQDIPATLTFLRDSKKPVLMALYKEYGQAITAEIKPLVEAMGHLRRLNRAITVKDIAPIAEQLVGLDRFLNRTMGEFDLATPGSNVANFTLAAATRHATQRTNGAFPGIYEAFNDLVKLAETAIEQKKAPHMEGKLAEYGRAHFSEGVHIA